MVQAFIRSEAGRPFEPEPVVVYPDADQPFFIMPDSIIRTGHYILEIQGRPQSAIFVWASSRESGYFRFVAERPHL